jgi:pimeloyl-ACP methyl ester carboxylesterase
MPQTEWLQIQCQSPAGAHRMAVRSWGLQTAQQVVVCVHGLTRVSQDFEPLADRLSDRYWVLAPDVVGRGQSDWLADPSHYHVGQYALDMQAMAQQLGLSAVHWVGTSMGGLIAMVMAGQAALGAGLRFRSLVLNDVGAVVSGPALDRIGAYLGSNPAFSSFEQARGLVEKIFAGFGPHTPAQWDFLAQSVLKADSSGQWRFHYDPRIAEPFRSAIAANGGHAADMDLWSLYEQIQAPTLLMRGEQSDLLTEAVAREMTLRGPRAQLATIPGVGHAPSLLQTDQIDLIEAFISNQS